MCTRYITPDQRAIEGYVGHVPPWWQQSYDVRITSLVPVVRATADGERALEQMYWTLLPPKSDKKAWRTPTWNLRGERLEESRMYSAPFKSRRCVLPAAGFYEWPDVNGEKQRHCIRPADGGIFLFAGLWNPWTSKDGTEEGATVGIITTEANAFMRPLHNTGKNPYRMPVILDPQLGDTWMFGEVDEARALVGPCPDDWLQAYPMPRNLGNVPEQMEPAGDLIRSGEDV